MSTEESYSQLGKGRPERCFRAEGIYEQYGRIVKRRKIIPFSSISFIEFNKTEGGIIELILHCEKMSQQFILKPWINADKEILETYSNYCALFSINNDLTQKEPNETNKGN